MTEPISSNILIWTVVLCFLAAFYKWATQNYDYFRKKGLKSLKPTFLIGNSSNLFTRKFAMCDYLVHIYEQFPQEKIFGVFQFRSPLYVLRDPDIIKQVGIKEFDNFMDHKTFITDEMDPLLGNALVALTGDKWRDMRATLSPVFTGSKMRNMFELVTKCAESMATTFKKEAKAGQTLAYEMKDLFSRFTNDVVATSAFGLEVNSFEDRENPFFTLGKTMMNFQSPIAGLKIVGFLTAPWLMKLFGVQFLNRVSTEYFTHIIRQNFKTRESDKIVRNDVIQLLMQMQKGRLDHRPDEKAHDDAGFATVEESELGKQVVKRQWSEIELIAQCFIFFLAGFDTAATLLSFLSYELAVNSEVQQRLFEEIEAVDRSLSGEPLTYEAIQKMKYLDQVISEALRKWPPAPLTDRQCVRTCNLSVDGKLVTVEKGTSVWVPIYALHHDEKYYPRPEVFDPDRFSDENKATINPGAYLPFGIGPRNCIGSRFALMSAKAAVFHLLLNFTIEVTEKTDVPIKIAKTAAGFSAENGIHLELKPR